MNAALLMMTSTLMAGADAAPVAPAAPAYVAGPGCSGPDCGGPSYSGPSYGGSVSASCDTCVGGKASFCDRLKARFGGMGSRRSRSSAYAPVACDTCGTAEARPNLLDRIKARCGKKKSADCSYAAPACSGYASGGCGSSGCVGDGCATPVYDHGATTPYPAAPTTPVTPTDPPKDMSKEMPKPKDVVPSKEVPGKVVPSQEIPKKTLPKTGTSSDLSLPAIPAISPGASVTPPSPITPVSGPKLNGTNSPY